MHECRVDGGRAHCDCKVGYILAEDGKTCEGKIVMVFFFFFNAARIKCSAGREYKEIHIEDSMQNNLATAALELLFISAHLFFYELSSRQ